MIHLKQLIKILIIFIISINNVTANQCSAWFSNLTAPVCTDAKYIFWSGLIIAGALRLSKESFVDELQNRATEKNHLKKWGEFGGDVGYGYLNGAYLLGQLTLGGKHGAERAEHMLESSFYTLGITWGLKKSIHESRPGHPDDPDSFPSGHSSFAFAFAAVVSAQHGWAWGAAAHLVASFIAFSRINDDWHYAHDVVAGATIGMSYGWGIYFNHQEHNKPYWLAFMPAPDLKGLALGYNYHF